jgi:hypothetical protein
MARKLRLEFAGACYHVLNRGNYRRDLFAAAGAADSFAACLDQACTRFGWARPIASLRCSRAFAREIPDSGRDPVSS